MSFVHNWRGLATSCSQPTLKLFSFSIRRRLVWRGTKLILDWATNQKMYCLEWAETLISGQNSQLIWSSKSHQLLPLTSKLRLRFNFSNTTHNRATNKEASRLGLLKFRTKNRIYNLYILRNNSNCIFSSTIQLSPRGVYNLDLSRTNLLWKRIHLLNLSRL